MGLVNSTKGYRDRLEIIRDILLVVASKGSSGSRKTHIMYGANLSYHLLTKYLDEVLNASLVCAGNSCYTLTDKGREFLQYYRDYEKRRREIEDRIEHLNNGRELLAEMLMRE